MRPWWAARRMPASRRIPPKNKTVFSGKCPPKEPGCCRVSYFVVGLYLGFAATLFSLLLACVLGLLFAFLRKTFGKAIGEPIPFGPSIAAAAAVMLLYGDPLVRWYLGISNFFRKGWPYILVILAIIILVYKIVQKTESGQMALAKLLLKLPVLGEISLLNGASQFAGSMSTMLSAGLPLAKAVSITGRTMDNYYLSDETGKLVSKLEEGKALGTSMAEAAYLPDILVDMVNVGEETGEMEETMRTISGYYDSELEMATDSAMKKLEPALLVVMAVIAGFIVVAIYMASSVCTTSASRTT